MITLYHVPGSRSMRSLWLLNELELAYELVSMPFKLSSLRAPEYLAVHPLGRVPALADGERVIFESGAIAQYLCAFYDTKGLGRSVGDPDWPEWIQWIHYAETMAVHGASLVQQRVFIAPENRSSAVADLESKRLIKALEVIDRRLEGRDYLLGPFTAADTSVGYSVHLARMFLDTAKLENVGAYYARCSARPAFRKAIEGESEAQPVQMKTGG
jgi:glutathione S-transferase